MPFTYDRLPELLPAGEYHLDGTYVAIINGKRRPYVLVQNFGEIKTKTAAQWKK